VTRVFIGGSRDIKTLDVNLSERLRNIIVKGYTIVIGDAEGADKMVQEFLVKNGYKNVFVYFTGDRYRNNVGEWETVNIKGNRKSRSFEFYALKDSAMAEIADFGFMINIINLLWLGKTTLVYFTGKKSFFTLTSLRDLKDILSLCEKGKAKFLEDKFHLAKTLHPEQEPMELNVTG
jgi:hypothetical protein